MVSSHPAPPPFLRLAAHPLRWRLLTALATCDLRVRELTALAGEPQNLVSYHLRLLRDGGLVSATRSTFDGRDSYYHLDLRRCATALGEAGTALHPALRREPAAAGSAGAGPAGAEPAGGRSGPARAGNGPAGNGSGRAGMPAATGPRRAGVLFVCTGNSARSPIAEALLRQRTGGRVEVTSAGSRPRPATHPDAVRVLREDFGVDLGDRRPRHWDTLTGHRFDHVISLCDKAREVCPDFPERPRRVHWSIPDPGGLGYSGFRSVAADIDTRIGHLLPVLEETPS